MKNKFLILITLTLLILTACKKVPEEVKNIKIDIKSTALKEIDQLNSQTINKVIDNKLYVNSVIEIPQKDVINSYEMIPKTYKPEDIFTAFKMEKSDFEIAQGESNNASNDEPVVLNSINYTLYIDNKRGQVNLINNNIRFDFMTQESEIPLNSVKDNIDLIEAQNIIYETLSKLELDCIIDETKAYTDGKFDYYFFRLAQVIDDVRLDNEDNSFMNNDTLADGHRIEIIMSNEGIIYFQAKLCEMKEIKESYNKLISLDSALEIIEQKIDLILPKNNNFVQINNKVNINKIELIYVPQYIDSNKLHYIIIPVWSFESGRNIGTNRFCNIKINAITGSLL